VQFWIREFTTKKRKQNDAARKKIKILKGTTVKQQRKEYERYLKNMAGWKLVDLKPYSDKEVFDLYQQAKRRTDTFYHMGCAEDLEQIAQMNKKLVSEKVAEAEHVQEADVV
jgi:CHASE3 domain sensor protein